MAVISMGSGFGHCISNTHILWIIETTTISTNAIHEVVISPQLSSALSSPVLGLVPRIALRGGAKKVYCYQKRVAGIQLHWIVRTRALDSVISDVNQVPNTQITLTSHLKTI